MPALDHPLVACGVLDDERFRLGRLLLCDQRRAGGPSILTCRCLGVATSASVTRSACRCSTADPASMPSLLILRRDSKPPLASPTSKARRAVATPAVAGYCTWIVFANLAIRPSWDAGRLLRKVLLKLRVGAQCCRVAVGPAAIQLHAARAPSRDARSTPARGRPWRCLRQYGIERELYLNWRIGRAGDPGAQLRELML